MSSKGGEKAERLAAAAWAKRLTGFCLSPDCDEVASAVHDGRWCEAHGNLLKRVRAELAGRKIERLTPTINPEKQNAREAEEERAERKTKEVRRADGLCLEGCGRKARARRLRCQRCRVGRMVPTCAQEGCEYVPHEDGPYCYRHRRAATPGTP